MARALYVAALEPDTGKSVVALGMMRLLTGRAGRVGFFRPLVSAVPDPLSMFVAEHFRLALDPATAYGATYAEAHQLDGDALVSRVVERYRAIEDGNDVVLCVGSDFTDVAAPTEFALNLRLAHNLGAPVLAVVSGRNRPAERVVAAVRSARASLAAADNAVVAVVANQVDPAAVDAVRDQLDGTGAGTTNGRSAGTADAGAGTTDGRSAETTSAGDGDPPTYVLPYDPVLTEPTLADIRAALDADLLFGDPDELDRDVRGVVVGAATLPTVLDHLTDGALVIVPGDRDDILLGMLAAGASSSAPHVSGLLLTAGLLPDERVRRLLDGLAPETPVLTVGTDTFVTAQAVAGVRGSVTAGSGRKVDAALATFTAAVDLTELAGRVELTRSRRVTPLMFEYDLVERARSDRRHIVLPEGDDDRILRAADVVLRRGIAEVTLLGSPDAVRQRAAALGLAALDGVRVLSPTDPALRERFAAEYAEARTHRGMTVPLARDIVTDVSYFGTLMVHCGLADGMVSGAAHTTAHTVRPAFEIMRAVSTVSSVFFMCLADRVLVYGDCAINPDPDAAQLAEIALSSAATAAQFGVEPRVAMLSYSTGDSGSGAEVDKVRAASALVRERAPSLPVAGPIQYDAAVDASVARTKMPDDPVAGRATVFVFPDLNTGNNTYKAVQRSAGAVAVGPVLQGLRKPVNDLSRGCTVADIVNTVAITAIQAQG